MLQTYYQKSTVLIPQKKGIKTNAQHLGASTRIHPFACLLLRCAQTNDVREELFPGAVELGGLVQTLRSQALDYLPISLRKAVVERAGSPTCGVRLLTM